VVIILTTSQWIAQRILNLCQEKNISVNKLATLSGVTQSTINSIMHGESKNPRISTLRKVASGLGISIGELLRDIEKANLSD